MKKVIFLLFIFTGIVYGETLNQLVETAYRKNPKLKSIEERLKAIKERAIFESSLTDPIFSIAINDIQFDNPFKRNIEPMQTVMFSISQYIPYKGKLSLKKEIQLKIHDKTYYKLLSEGLDIEYRIKVLSYEYWFLKETLKIIEQYKKVVKEVINISDTLYSVGKATQSDVINSHIYLTDLIEEEIYIKNKLSVIKARLKKLVNENVEDINIELPKPREITNLEFIREEIISQNPELKVIKMEIEKNITELKLAKRDYYPDFKPFFSYAYRHTFNDYISFGVSFNLPVWKKKRQDKKVLETEYIKLSNEKLYADKLNQLFSTLEESFFECKNAFETYELLDETLLKQALESFSSVISEYKVGKRDMLTVLNSIKKIIGVEKMKLKEIYLWNKYYAQIEKLTGKSLRGNRHEK